MANILLRLNLEQLIMLAHNEYAFFRIMTRVKDFSEVSVLGASVLVKLGNNS